MVHLGISPRDIEQLATIAFLAPKSINVDAINKKIMDRFKISSPLDEREEREMKASTKKTMTNRGSFYPGMAHGLKLTISGSSFRDVSS